MPVVQVKVMIFVGKLNFCLAKHKSQKNMRNGSPSVKMDVHRMQKRLRELSKQHKATKIGSTGAFRGLQGSL